MMLPPEWLLTPERAAVHRPTCTAVIADLHLGYDEARRRRGEAVPVRSPDEIFQPLRALAECERIERLVIAGDLLEDGRCTEAIDPLLHWLEEAGIVLAGVVPGNHDRGLASLSNRLPLCPGGVELGGWRIVHGDGATDAGRVVQGHVHPWLRWHGIAAPCYLVRAGHLVLPAFSAEASGVNVLTDPRWQDYRCQVIAGERVLDFGEVGAIKPPARSRGDRAGRP